LNPDTESILIVDSAKMGLKPGDFRFFKPSEVSTRKEIAGFSTHEADLLKVLELARLTGTPIPPIAIMGIEPETVKPEIGLSRTLEGRLAEYAEAASGWDFFSSPPPR
jgi:hydrogenase maturation protease